MRQLKGEYFGLALTLLEQLEGKFLAYISFAVRTNFKGKKERRPPFLSGVGLAFL